MTGIFVPALSCMPSRIGDTSGAAAAVVRNSRRVLGMCDEPQANSFRSGLPMPSWVT